MKLRESLFFPNWSASSQRPPIQPNLDMLQNALDQTQRAGCFDAASWKSLLQERIENMEIRKLLNDVEAFLKRPSEKDLFTRDTFLCLLSA